MLKSTHDTILFMQIGRDVDRQVGGMNRDLQDSFRSLDQDLDRVGKSIRDIGKNTQREFRGEALCIFIWTVSQIFMSAKAKQNQFRY